MKIQLLLIAYITSEILTACPEGFVDNDGSCKGLPRIEFNNLQEPLLLKLPDNTVGRLQFEFWVYPLNRERNSEADRLIDIIVNQRSSFKFMFKYEVTKELYLQFERFKSPIPLDYNTWWHISTSIDYITPTSAKYRLTNADHSKQEIVKIIQPVVSFPFRLSAVLIGDHIEHSFAYYFRELRLWSDNYFPSKIRDNAIQYLQMGGVQEMPVGLIAGWNFDLGQGFMVKSYVGTTFDVLLSDEYIQTIQQGGGLEGTSLLELNPCPFGTVMKDNIPTTQCVECLNNCYICAPNLSKCLFCSQQIESDPVKGCPYIKQSGPVCRLNFSIMNLDPSSNRVLYFQTSTNDYGSTQESSFIKVFDTEGRSSVTRDYSLRLPVRARFSLENTRVNRHYELTIKIDLPLMEDCPTKTEENADNLFHLTILSQAQYFSELLNLSRERVVREDAIRNNLRLVDKAVIYATTLQEISLSFREISAILKGIALLFFPPNLGHSFYNTLHSISKIMGKLLNSDYNYSTININVAYQNLTANSLTVRPDNVATLQFPRQLQGTAVVVTKQTSPIFQQDSDFYLTSTVILLSGETVLNPGRLQNQVVINFELYQYPELIQLIARSEDFKPRHVPDYSRAFVCTWWDGSKWSSQGCYLSKVAVTTLECRCHYVSSYSLQILSSEVMLTNDNFPIFKKITNFVAYKDKLSPLLLTNGLMFFLLLFFSIFFSVCESRQNSRLSVQELRYNNLSRCVVFKAPTKRRPGDTSKFNSADHFNFEIPSSLKQQLLMSVLVSRAKFRQCLTFKRTFRDYLEHTNEFSLLYIGPFRLFIPRPLRLIALLLHWYLLCGISAFQYELKDANLSFYMDESKEAINGIYTHLKFAAYAYMVSLVLTMIFRIVIQAPFELRHSAMQSTKSYIETDIINDLKEHKQRMRWRHLVGYIVGLFVIIFLAVYVTLFSIVMHNSFVEDALYTFLFALFLDYVILELLAVLAVSFFHTQIMGKCWIRFAKCSIITINGYRFYRNLTY